MNPLWSQVTRARPCPICGTPDWCSTSIDGRFAACRRIEQGGRAKTDRHGAPFYLHRLTGSDSPSMQPPIPTGANVERADADTLHAAYSALLAQLPLSAAHRAALQRHGLTDAEIEHRGYRTMPKQGRARLARDLLERFGDSLLHAPGFIIRECRGSRYVTLAGAAGLLIPVRDVQGRIAALKIRRDESNGARYSYFSSLKYGGPGPGAPVHVPKGSQSAAETGRLTEGELKADVAFVRSGLPTISVPGVNNWRDIIPILKTPGWKTVRLALDGDAKDKPHVARALGTIAEALPTEGFEIELERWPADYKGIDDALAAGVDIVVLAGDAARQGIAEIVTEGTAGEFPHAAGPLDRLAETLAEGAEALFRDRELLLALAQLAETDPAGFACRSDQIRNARVHMRELNAVLKPLRREIRAASPPLSNVSNYGISGSRIVYLRPTMDGVVEVPLCNFSARIVETNIRDDGTERIAAFVIEGTLVNGRTLPSAIVNTGEFARLDWITPAWQGRAVINAGYGTRDHLRCAIELLSPERTERVEYLHTGWREIGGKWFYLHAGGAIGANGKTDGISVALPPALSRFELPEPPDGNRLIDAVRASLRLLDLGPPHIMFPLLGAVFRATLVPSDFSVHSCGPTGTFKTEVAALCEQHFGAGMDSRNLPGSWLSTGNSLEALAFTAKDALIVVDDFSPTGSMADIQRSHREADRVLRAQGNAAGRARCRADGTFVPGKPPRGLILSTGEETPRGQSLRARLLVVEFSKGDIDAACLTDCQQDAANGLYAESLSGFLRWTAQRYQVVLVTLRANVARLRAAALFGTVHRRTPEIIANLCVGLEYFFAFAEAVGAITAAAKSDLCRRAWSAMGEAAASQVENLAAAEPVDRFLRLISATLASGRAHLADPNGNEPIDSAAWGWREQRFGASENSREERRPQGRRIGWIDGADLFLEPEAAYAEAQELAHSQGDSLPVSSQILRKRMNDRRLLVTTETGKLTTRRTLEGQRRSVIHLHKSALCAEKPGESGEQRDAQSEQSNPVPRPDLDVGGVIQESGEQNEEGTVGNSDSAPVPPIPPDSGMVNGQSMENSTKIVCGYQHHQMRWRSKYGVVLCGICVPPARDDLVAEWLDGPPTK